MVGNPGVYYYISIYCIIIINILKNKYKIKIKITAPKTQLDERGCEGGGGRRINNENKMRGKGEGGRGDWLGHRSLVRPSLDLHPPSLLVPALLRTSFNLVRALS